MEMEGVVINQGLKYIFNEPFMSSYRAPFNGSDDILVHRGSSQMVPFWTCTKLCALAFVAGLCVGSMLKRHAQRWADKLRRRMRVD